MGWRSRPIRDVQGSIEGASGEWVWRDGEREEGIEERERKGERSSQSWIDVATDTT